MKLPDAVLALKRLVSSGLDLRSRQMVTACGSMSLADFKSLLKGYLENIRIQLAQVLLQASESLKYHYPMLIVLSHKISLNMLKNLRSI